MAGLCKQMGELMIECSAAKSNTIRGDMQAAGRQTDGIDRPRLANEKNTLTVSQMIQTNENWSEKLCRGRGLAHCTCGQNEPPDGSQTPPAPGGGRIIIFHGRLWPCECQ